MKYRDKLGNIGFKNINYLFLILSNIILLSGDVEVNPGPISGIAVKNQNLSRVENNMSTYKLEPSTSTRTNKMYITEMRDSSDLSFNGWAMTAHLMNLYVLIHAVVLMKNIIHLF